MYGYFVRLLWYEEMQGAYLALLVKLLLYFPYALLLPYQPMQALGTSLLHTVLVYYMYLYMSQPPVGITYRAPAEQPYSRGSALLELASASVLPPRTQPAVLLLCSHAPDRGTI